MQPLSKNKRRLYLSGFIALFFLCIPVVILFASGFRFKSGYGFVKTGGVFISVPYSEAIVSMNGKDVGTSGLLKRGFYIDDLSPGSYVILVTREGYRPWYRTLVVEQEIVSDARALLIPEEIEAVLLAYGTSAASSTRVVSRADYNEYLAAFDIPAATTTRGVSGESVVVEDGNVYVRLTEKNALPTSNFCGRPSYCVSEIPIEQGKQTAINAASFGGAVVYATKEGGVFLAEADIRPTAVSVPLYPQRGAEFRVIDGELIVKDDDDLYQISL
jgi:hypothetical protein